MRYPYGEARENPGHTHISRLDRAVIGLVTARSGVKKVAGASSQPRTSVSTNFVHPGRLAVRTRLPTHMPFTIWVGK
jgi:hypothetical protein